ncbi:encapsulin [Variovorax sp. M-6]|uniref:encapsulin n=1 Tax=Variovorax sp. M-6 TaxID=3233041 RepID=UPI003F9611E1
MTDNNQQVPWTDEQWARVRKVIQEEAARARVGASFLPLVGPLPPSTDYVSIDTIEYGEVGNPRLSIDDRTTVQLVTLQVRVYLRGAQMADPDMASALQLFRRAANVLARLEDHVVFNGLQGPNEPPPPELAVGKIMGGQASEGLADGEVHDIDAPDPDPDPKVLGGLLVSAVSECIGDLERAGHFGPFAVVFDHAFFTAVQTPNEGSLVLPQDRIIPFLGGGPLLRSSTLPERAGIVVALGAEPVELVVATDVSLSFLQVTPEPEFVFRVYEKIVLRIKEKEAIRVIRIGDDEEQEPNEGGAPDDAQEHPVPKEQEPDETKK